MENLYELRGPITWDNRDELLEWCGGQRADDIRESGPAVLGLLRNMGGVHLVRFGDSLLRGPAMEHYVVTVPLVALHPSLRKAANVGPVDVSPRQAVGPVDAAAYRSAVEAARA